MNGEKISYRTGWYMLENRGSGHMIYCDPGNGLVYQKLTAEGNEKKVERLAKMHIDLLISQLQRFC